MQHARRHWQSKFTRAFGGLALALVLIGSGAGSTMAQSTATPAPVVGTVKEAHYPVSIHKGTCESLVAQPTYTLTDATPWGLGEDDAKEVGTNPGPLPPISDSTVPAKLDDLTTEPHVLVIHESPEAYGTIAACGQIAGVEVDGKLVIHLDQIDDSRLVGVAVLRTSDSFSLTFGENDISLTDEEVQVTVYLSRLS